MKNAARFALARSGRTILALAGAAFAAGVLGAAFVWALAGVTAWRQSMPQMLWLLPLAGWLLGQATVRWAGAAVGGTPLVVNALRQPSPSVEILPGRMAPVVVLGTLWTHAFGGSAGREGTAMQLGASLALSTARLAGIVDATPILLRAGVAAGFGAVFGTPWAAAVFAIELGGHRRPAATDVLAAVGCAWGGHGVATVLGAPHADWPTAPATAFDGTTVVAFVGLGLAVALAVRLFLWLSRQVHGLGVAAGWSLPTRLALGGAAVALLALALGTDVYLGLGLETIVAATHQRVDGWWVPLWKIVFTSLTVGSGFVGGEVTPLFFVGATLGSYATPWLGASPSVGAGAGLVGAFAAAAHTPLAMIVMAAELFGVAIVPPAAIVCVVAWLAIRPAGLYVASEKSRRPSA